MSAARLAATLSFCALLGAGCMSQPAAPYGGPQMSPAETGVDEALQRRCTTADWRATGYRHGVSGFGQTAFAALQEKCAGAGVKIDRLSYATGRLEGLKRYCTRENGYRLAAARKLPEGGTPCPPELAQAFEQGVAAARVN